MRYSKVFIAIVIAGLLITGCKGKDEEAEVREFLERCWFIGGENRALDDSTNTPNLMLLGDTFPFYVKWARFIEQPIERHYEIDVKGDSAFVTMTAYFKGTPPKFGFFVRNDTTNPLLIYRRAISDSAVRRIKCYRDDDGWHLASLTVADIYTSGTPHPINITGVRAFVASRNYEFIVNDPDRYFTKEELPIFYPNDTVEVTVTCNAQGDSTWAFLHHGAGHRPGSGLKRHWRKPFYRENTITFKRTWIIADDSVITTPAVRHSAIDVIGWATLFGDSTKTYYSRAWALPYIIKRPNDTLPDDTEE